MFWFIHMYEDDTVKKILILESLKKIIVYQSNDPNPLIYGHKFDNLRKKKKKEKTLTQSHNPIHLTRCRPHGIRDFF